MKNSKDFENSKGSKAEKIKNLQQDSNKEEHELSDTESKYDSIKQLSNNSKGMVTEDELLTEL